MKHGLEVEMLSLKQLEFEELDGEYKIDAKPSFFMEVEVSEATQGISPVSWVLAFEFTSLFRIRALYRMYVSNRGGDVFEKDELISETYYRVLTEFSVLIATLTKALGTTPLVIEPGNLMDLGGYGRQS